MNFHKDHTAAFGLLLSAVCFLLASQNNNPSPISAPAPPPQISGSTVPERLGVNIHFTQAKPGEAKMLADSGARWIRVDFFWHNVERSKGQYYFVDYDSLMATLRPYNIRPLFILDYENKFYDNGLAPYTDVGRQAFAQWAAASVQHFQGQGVLWEMWNEPNSPFWKPKANVQDYIKLAVAVGQAIRNVAPAEAYIGPGVQGFDFAFLEACFKAGLLNYWSAVSLHPYRDKADPETVSPGYDTLRALMAKYAPPGKQIPIIASEWGYSTEWPLVHDPDRQAGFLARTLLTDVASGIPVTIWYAWGSAPGFSLVDPTLHPSPAYIAFQTLTSLLAGYTFSSRISLPSVSDYLLLFAPVSGSGGNKYVAWTTAAPHSVSASVPSGHLYQTSYLGETLPDLTAGTTGLNLQLTDAPIYLETTRNLAAQAAKPGTPKSAATPAVNLTAQQSDSLKLAWDNLLRGYQDLKAIPPEAKGDTSRLEGHLQEAMNLLHRVDPAHIQAAPAPASIQIQDEGHTTAFILSAVKGHLDKARNVIESAGVASSDVTLAVQNIAVAEQELGAAGAAAPVK
jgi:polysaccharide biosynthesis protein PslG